MSQTVMFLSPPCASVDAWSRVEAELDALQTPHLALQLPSCTPASDLDDAAFVRARLDALEDPVVLVAHSNGGLLMTEVGEHEMVRHLVYVDAPLWDVGEDWPGLLRTGVERSWGECFQRQADAVELVPERVEAYFSGRGWPEKDIREFLPGLRPQRQAATFVHLTKAAWRAVPSTFVWPQSSELKPHLQELFASRATNRVKVEGDHFPHWRRPQEVARLIADVALGAG